MLEENLATAGGYNAALHEWYNHAELGPKYGVFPEPAQDSLGVPTEVPLSPRQRAAKDGFFDGHQGKPVLNWIKRILPRWLPGWVTGITQEEREAYEDCHETGKNIRLRHDALLDAVHLAAFDKDETLPDKVMNFITPLHKTG
jgi:hypothetical protein